MTHRPGCARLALAGLLLVPALAAAASTAHHSHASLDVTRRASAARCPAEKDVRRDVTAILGYGPFDKNARRRVSAVLWATDGTYHARIQLKDSRTHKSLGVRELSAAGPTCEELGQAMVLAIALAIDPLAQPPPPRVAAVQVPPAAASTGAAAATGATAVGAPLPGTIASSAGGSAAPARPPARNKPPPAPKVATATLRDAGVEALPPLPPDAGASASDAGALVELADAGASLPDAGTLAEAPPDAGPLAVTPPPEAPAVDAGAPAEAPPTPVVATAVAVPAAPAPPPPAPPETRAFDGIAGAGAEWTVGLVPQRAFGVFVHGGIALPHLLAELELGWLPSTSFAFSPGHISTSLWTGALVACGTFSGFGICGVVQTGPFTSQGSGFPTNSSQTTWLFALGVRGQWDWVFAHPVGLRLQAAGLYNAVQTRIQVGTGGAGAPLTAWTAPVFALTLGAGLFVVF